VLKSHELIKFSYYNSDDDKNKGIVVEDLDDITIELIEGYVRK